MTQEDHDLKQLEDKLTEASNIFFTQQTGNPIDDCIVPHNQREGVGKSLQAVLQYFRAKGFNAKLSTPIMQLLFAIAEVDEGVKSNPLLTPRKRDARGGRPSLLNQRMATAAAAVDLYVEASMPMEQALKIVARNLVLEEKSYIQLKNYREKLRRGKQSEEAIECYRKRLAEAKANCPGSPETAAQILLSILNSSTAE